VVDIAGGDWLRGLRSAIRESGFPHDFAAARGGFANDYAE
jgi:hypothetical protein